MKEHERTTILFKNLLFGEYGIIKDSKGLSIPYNFYNGALKIDEKSIRNSIKSNESLKSVLLIILKELIENPT